MASNLLRGEVTDDGLVVPGLIVFSLGAGMPLEQILHTPGEACQGDRGAFLGLPFGMR